MWRFGFLGLGVWKPPSRHGREKGHEKGDALPETEAETHMTYSLRV